MRMDSLAQGAGSFAQVGKTFAQAFVTAAQASNPRAQVANDGVHDRKAAAQHARGGAQGANFVFQGTRRSAQVCTGIGDYLIKTDVQSHVVDRDGTTTHHSTPPTSDVINGVAAIAAGYGHTCALMTSGGVRCWGANGNGRLGILPPDHTRPAFVVGICQYSSFLKGR
jgi:hypothetical protein